MLCQLRGIYSLRWSVVGRVSTKQANQAIPDGETHLGSRISRVIFREIDFTEAPFAEKFVRDPHLVLGDLHLVELTLPPCPANCCQSLRFGLVDGSLAEPRQSKGDTQLARHAVFDMLAELR